jgi:hypothetical protein
MANVYNGIPTAAQIISVTDALTAIFQINQPSMGLGLPGETGTSAAAAALLKVAVVGDGTTSNPGLGSILGSTLAGSCDSLLQRERWDAIWSNVGRNFITALDSQIQSNMPAGWVFTNTTSAHYLNSWLLRINANAAATPVTPASAGVLTAVNNVAGALPSTVIGNCPRVVHTLVGAFGFNESQPSPEATQIAIAGTANALSYQIAGTVPAGVSFVRTFRSYIAGATSVYFYVGQTAVVAGSTFPAIIIATPDSALRQDVNPPAFLSCQLKAESAVIAALAYAVSLSGIQPGIPMSLTASNMIAPTNVSLNATSAFLGLGNPVSSGIFGTRLIGTGYTQGTIQTTNSDASALQGFSGSLAKLQARVTSVMNAAGSLTATYSYLAAGTGLTPQSATTASASFSGATVGSIAPLVIPAGRLVTAVTTDTPTGQTSGTYIIEGISPR